MRKGSVLIIVSWSLCILTIFAVSLSYSVRQKRQLSSRIDAAEKLRLIAEAGVRRSIAELRILDETPTYDALNESWSTDQNAFREVAVGSGYYSVAYQSPDDAMTVYGLIDESRKVSLNTAETDILARLFEYAAGLDQEKATELAYCVVDWRDADSFFQHPRYGAEDSEYRFLKESYEAKDADFEVIEEFLLVIGATEEIFASIKGYITVYGTGAVNINTAPRAVLMALGMGSELADKIIAYRKGKDAAQGTQDDRVFYEVGTVISALRNDALVKPTEEKAFNDLVAKGVIATSSAYFTAVSTAHMDGARGLTMRIEAVIDRQGTIKHWREEIQ